MMEPAADTVTVKRSTILWVFFILVAFGIGLGAGYLAWGQTPPVTATPQVTGTVQQRLNVPVGTLPAFGPANAPITIIEFSDFECPFCRKWVQETWPLIAKTYPGKVRLYYRDFPLSGHTNAIPAAVAARCSAEQNQFWAFHDKLFSGSSFGNSVYETYASALGLDLAKFKACVQANRYEKEVNADLEFGANLGIRGTPTFFINGIPLVGAQPFSAFQKIIDQELASKK
jgi:protein-disulfide isomerase